MSAISKVAAAAKAAASKNNSSSSSSSNKSSSSSSNSSSSSSGYGSGSGYGNRETAFTWKDGSTTYSNATNWQDAAKEAGKTNVGLASASTYYSSGTQKNNGSYSSGGGSDGKGGTNGQTSFTNNIYSQDSQTGKTYDNALTYEKALAEQYGMKVAGVNAPIGTNVNIAPLPSLAETIANQNSAQYGLSDSASNIANYSNVLNQKAPQQYDLPEYEGITANQIKNQYNDIYDAQEQAARNQLNALKQQYDYNADQLNQTYDKNATQNYTDYMMSTKNLPQQLRALGLSGGASETSLMGAEANYQNALNENELARANSLNQNNLAYANNEAEYGTNIAQIYATLQQSAMSAVMQAQQAESEYNQWVQEYQAARTDADRSYAMQQAQLAQENANTLYNQAQQQTQYSDNLKQQALENAYAAAKMGDFTQLKALGVNTTAAEADYALAQQTATAQYNKQYGTGISGSSASSRSAGISGSSGGIATALPTVSTPAEPKVYSVIDDALGSFESSNGLAYNAKYLVQNGVFTKDEYNSWARSRGKTTI